ncbi:MAG: helix-turn-helix domain-containing protein [bacterium]|nr:helix-turn-helix domain-containing protein [bacterium]
MPEYAEILGRLGAIESRLDALSGSWPEWMSIEAAARYCDCSARKIRRAIQSGVLKVSRPTDGYHADSHVRIARTSLDTWMQGSSQGLPVLARDGRIEGKAKLEALRAGASTRRERE